jgi:hypothetical protein
VRESAHTISALNFFAREKAKSDFPDAVGPTITTIIVVATTTNYLHQLENLN